MQIFVQSSELLQAKVRENQMGEMRKGEEGEEWEEKEAKVAEERERLSRETTQGGPVGS